MASGWGIRGSFGHSRGAMMPGAMLGLSLAICSRRTDWWQRAAILGLLCAIGWGFGGTSSYGRLIHYSMQADWTTSLYGYGSLFIVGALYGGIGAACLALALTARRSFLEASLGPLFLTYSLWLLLEWLGVKRWSLELFAKDPSQPDVTAWLYDTLWLCAVSNLALCLALWPWVGSWRKPLQLMMLLFFFAATACSQAGSDLLWGNLSKLSVGSDGDPSENIPCSRNSVTGQSWSKFSVVRWDWG